MLEHATLRGKHVAHIEGDPKKLNSPLEPMLSVNEGLQDGKVFIKTHSENADNKQLVFTHFHSIDDDATTYGPYAQETLDQILQVDQMVQNLVESFDGTIIITADHGLHETQSGGTHGRICGEDMLVPYIIISN